MTLTVSSTQEASTRQPLTRAACLALLAPGGNGRVAATKRSLPIIIPVRFTVFGDDVILGPDPREGLSTAVADSVVAFQADHVGSDGHPPWAVHVTGVARTIANGSEAPSFRLSSEIITGWRAGS